MAPQRKLQRKLLLVIKNSYKTRGGEEKKCSRKYFSFWPSGECYYRKFFDCCSSYFFWENRRSLPRLPRSSSCSLQPAGGILSSKGSSSSDELSDSATLEERVQVCKLARKPCLLLTILDHSQLTLLIPGRHSQRSSGVINRLNAHADTRENTFPKFMH